MQIFLGDQCRSSALLILHPFILNPQHPSSTFLLLLHLKKKSVASPQLCFSSPSTFLVSVCLLTPPSPPPPSFHHLASACLTSPQPQREIWGFSWQCLSVSDKDSKTNEHCGRGQIGGEKLTLPAAHYYYCGMFGGRGLFGWRSVGKVSFFFFKWYDSLWHSANQAYREGS